MEKERKIKVLSLVALMVAVLGLTVAFAALSQTLTINGTASVNAAEWDVHFANLGEAETYGDVTVTPPTLSGTTLSGYSVTLTKPGDYVAYEFDIVNNGTVDASIDKITMPTKYKECLMKSKLDPEDECKMFDFDDNNYLNVIDTSVYNTMINYGLYYVDNDKKVSQSDELLAGETKRVKLVVEYSETATRLPEKNFTIVDDTMPVTINYVQAD